jgi:hypothetical protein
MTKAEGSEFQSNLKEVFKLDKLKEKKVQKEWMKTIKIN